MPAPGASQDYSNHRIRRVDIATGETTTLAGSTQGFLDGGNTTVRFRNPTGVAIAPSAAFALVAVRAWPRTAPASRAPADGAPASRPPRAHTVAPSEAVLSPAHRAAGLPLSPSVPAPGASQDFSNHRIRRVDIATGETATLAGSGSTGFLDGVGTSARFYYPYGVAIAPSGAFALVAVRAWPRTAPASARSRRRRTRLAPAPGTPLCAL